MAKSAASESSRKPRADALRNRDHIVAVAREAFAELGDALTLEEVVKRSGFGVGTLYRHFKSRDALFEAVYLSEVEKLAAAADYFSESRAPADALEEWMLLFADFLATKYAVKNSLTEMVNYSQTTASASKELIQSSIDRLTARAVKSGDIRLDLEPLDLLRALTGIANAGSERHWLKRARGLVQCSDGGNAHSEITRESLTFQRMF